MKICKWKLNLLTFLLVVSAHSRASMSAECYKRHRGGGSSAHSQHAGGWKRRAPSLSHLPMFSALNTDKTDYTSPHRYQLILEVRFIREGKDVTDIYTKDRQSNGETKMYTLEPAPAFVLSKLFTPDTRNPELSSFRATVFRGHLERGGKNIQGLEDVVVDVKKVVHAHKFEPSEAKPEKLQYLLFGTGGELFLAHLITKPPDFDQILSVRATGHQFTDEELNRGVSVLFEDRHNTASQRIKENERAQGQFHVSGTNQSRDLQVQADTEYYFEEGELAMPAIFDQTSEEEEIWILILLR